MKKIIVANWKANKTKKQVKTWLDVFLKSKLPKNLQIIIAAPYVFLPTINPSLTLSDNTYLAAQDVSSYPPGSYTGQITASMLSEFVDFVLIGHSEARRYLHQTQEEINKKISLCQKFALTPIIFIAKKKHLPPKYPSSSYFVYEPPFAISTSNKPSPLNPQNAAEKITAFKKNVNSPKVKFLYGGSVDENNISSYLSFPQIDGVVPGKASLNISQFLKLIKNASCAI